MIPIIKFDLPRLFSSMDENVVKKPLPNDNTHIAIIGVIIKKRVCLTVMF
jgi:hypothetical protein